MMENILLSPRVRKMLVAKIPQEIKKLISEYWKDNDEWGPRKATLSLGIEIQNFSGSGTGHWKTHVKLYPDVFFPDATWEVFLPPEVKFLILTPLDNFMNRMSASGDIEFLAITESELKKVGERHVSVGNCDSRPCSVAEINS